jgi:preprotein translocase subunit YajC
MNPLVVIVVLAVLFWVLFALPARRRRRDHEGMQDELEVGDEVITAGGMHGAVRELGDRQLRIEIAPGVVVTVDRRAIAAVAVPDEEDDVVEGDADEESADPESASGDR